MMTTRVCLRMHCGAPPRTHNSSRSTTLSSLCPLSVLSQTRGHIMQTSTYAKMRVQKHARMYTFYPFIHSSVHLCTYAPMHLFAYSPFHPFILSSADAFPLTQTSCEEEACQMDRRRGRETEASSQAAQCQELEENRTNCL